MKAIRVHQFGGPEVLTFEDVAEPEPDEGQVVVHLTAIGINPVETYLRAGTYPIKPPLPYTPGSDAAGVIYKIGGNVSHLRVGDRVYVAGSIGGTYAEYALCNQRQVHPLPSSIADAQGAAVGVPYATAYRALFHRALAMPAETLLIHGASGGVGVAAVQLARAAGLTIIGTGGTEEGRELVKNQGAHFVLDHHAADFADRVMEITAGRGVNLILEMLANVNLGNDLNLLAKNGRVVVVGSRGPVQIDPRATMGRDASILGMSLNNASVEELTSIHAALGAGLENGTLRPVIGKEIPLAEAALAHKVVLEPGAYGKIVLLP
ncbi:MAG TPA: NADPH:quinone reductase [Pyrinomonadaceae bacterium]|jgi:NADPH2:quinone reductase|nr:NADPH:quinone reductase [Pyrinomonadaceae bacterium]